MPPPSPPPSPPSLPFLPALLCVLTWFGPVDKVLVGTLIMPLTELVLSVFTYYQVKRKLKALPLLLLNKVESVMRITCYLSVVQLVFGVPVCTARAHG